MRPARTITAEEERFRLEPFGGRACIVKRDPVEPEPVGTIILMAFRVTGYDQDCDGSLMARMERIDWEGQPTGFEPDHLGLYPTSTLVLTFAEWQALFSRAASLQQEAPHA